MVFDRLTLRHGLSACLAGLFLTAGILPLAAQKAQDTLRVVAPWEYTSNEPDDTGYILARMGIAETLVQVEPDGKLVGGVAERWAIDEDRLTWRFAIRAGRSFHDGTPVTAQNVAESLKKAFIGESLSAVPLESVSAQGDHVVIRTKTPFSTLPAFLVDYASVILAPSAYDAQGKVQKIVATGPYRLAKIEGKTVLELERFEAYGGAKPAISKARYMAVVNGDTRANIAVAGDADLVYTLAPTAISRINTAQHMAVESLTIPRIRPISFNSALPQFDDARVRQAISKAIDRNGIAAAILRHPESSATQLLPPILSDWHNKNLAPLSHDVAGAKRLLDEAGWIVGSDDIRVKNGVRLAAKMLVPSNRPEMPAMATAIQAQLRQIGMDLSLDVAPSSATPGAIKDGTMQMAFISRTYVNVPDVIATIIPDFTSERSNWGSMNWSGRNKMKQLTDEYVASFDEPRKAALRKDITALLHAEAPVIPVSWTQHTVAVSGNLKTMPIDPYEMRYLIDRAIWK